MKCRIYKSKFYYWGKDIEITTIEELKEFAKKNNCYLAAIEFLGDGYRTVTGIDAFITLNGEEELSYE